MNSISAVRKTLLAGLPAIGATIFAGALLAPQAQAGPAPMMMEPAANPNVWKWGVSLDYMHRWVDREEDYWSGDEKWNVDYDNFDGDLWGFTAFVVPPCFYDIMFDFSYRTGDLDGDFKNHSLEPQSEFGGPYEGRANFDRDEYVVGITVPCQAYEWIYGRLEYFNFQEDGEWNYDDGDVERQEYTLWGITGGIGARQSYPIANTQATIDLNGFLGLVYFDFEHEEKDGGGNTDWDDWGFLGRAGARVSYPIQTCLDVFLGCGYEYIQTDSDDLDMTNQGLFVNLGLKGEF